jgi:hypothetical protein
MPRRPSKRYRPNSTLVRLLHTTEEHNNNPIPLLIFAALIGLLFGKWWLGLLIGIGMTIVPGVATIALLINNVLLRIVGGAALVVGFPFYLAFTGIRRLVGGRGPADEED